MRVQRARVGVQLSHGTEGQRPLVGNVAERHAGDTGNVQCLRDFGQYLVEPPRPIVRCFRTVRALAEHERAAAVERARQQQLLQHAIHAIDRLADVLEHQNRTVQRRGEWGTDQRGDERQVAPDECTARAPWPDDARGGCAAAGFLLRHGRAVQRRTAVGREHGARGGRMEAGKVGAAQQGEMDRCHVGVAEDGFRMALEGVVVEIRKQAHRAIATAEAPDSVNFIVAECAIEVVQARRVGSGEVALAVQRVRARRRLPSELARVVAGAHELAFVTQRARGCHERNARARGERRRLSR